MLQAKSNKVSAIFVCLTALLLFSFFFMQCQINELNKKNDNLLALLKEQNEQLEASLHNQTALLYRTIGEVLPVVVPETEKEKFKNLQNSVHILANDINQQNLATAVALYTDFITKTPPWIQQELGADLLTVKYDIDYYSILNNYRQNSNLEEVIDSLQSFIITGNDYANIQDAIAYYNALIDRQTEAYNVVLSSLKEELDKAFGDSAITSGNLYSLMAKAESYADDDTLQKHIERLALLTSEAVLKERLVEEVAILQSQINDEKPENIEADTYSLYTEELAQILYQANTIKSLDVSELKTSIGNVSKSLSEYETKIKKRQEQIYATQITATLNNFKSEIEKIVYDDKFNITVSTFYENLARLKIEAMEFKHESSANIIQLIDKCNAALDNKRDAFMDSLNKKEEQSIKNYNKNALRTIEDVKQLADGIGVFDGEKNEKRISYLLRLEAIQTGYLYLPVQAVYQEIYQELLGGLNKEQKAQFAQRALDVKRRNLNENF